MMLKKGYWTIIPLALAGYEMVDSQRGALARHAIFPGNEMYKKIMAPRGTYLQTSRVLFSILRTENSMHFKVKNEMKDHRSIFKWI